MQCGESCNASKMFLDLPECSKESGQLVSLGQLYELGQGRASPQYSRGWWGQSQQLGLCYLKS